MACICTRLFPGAKVAARAGQQPSCCLQTWQLVVPGYRCVVAPVSARAHAPLLHHIERAGSVCTLKLRRKAARCYCSTETVPRHIKHACHMIGYCRVHTYFVRTVFQGASYLWRRQVSIQSCPGTLWLSAAGFHLGTPTPCCSCFCLSGIAYVWQSLQHHSGLHARIPVNHTASKQ